MASGTDLVAKLMLDNNDFTKGLMDSKNQLDAFKKVGSGVTTMLGKFAGAAGVALGGIELFTTAINSNSATQNTWNDILGTTKESVDSFFTSLTSGDWSIWENGISNAISLSRKYSQALRQLKNDLIIGDVRLTTDEKLLDHWDNVASDESKTSKEREAGFKEFLAQYEASKENLKLESINTNEKLTEILSSKGVNIKPEEVRSFVLKYLSSATKEGKDLLKYESKREELEATKKSLKDAYSMEGGAGILLAKKLEVDKKSLEDSIKQMEKDNPELVEGYKLKLNFATDEKLPELLDLIDKIEGLESREQQIDTQKISLQKDFDKKGRLKVEPKKSSYRGSTGGNDKDYEQFSISYYQQIIDKFEEIKKSARLSSDEIKDLNDQIDTAKDIIKYLDTDEGSGEYFYLWDILGKGSREEYGRLQDQNFKYPRKPGLVPEELFSESEKKWNDQMYNFLDKNGLYDKNGHIDNKKFLEFFKGSSNKLPTVQVEFKNGSLNKLREDRQKLVDQLNAAQTDEERVEIQAKIVANQKQEQNIMNKLDGKKMFSDKIAKANEYSQAIQNISASIMALNATKFENNAQGWTQWTTSVLSQAASVIAAYYSMAMAAGTANAFKMPFPANLAVWGSITAAIISTFASLPKFADGGIFAGNSTSGDMNLARVNAGEMILNNRQQRNLFNLLNNGGSSVGSSGKVEFKIRGKELVGVLSNYNNKMSNI